MDAHNTMLLLTMWSRGPPGAGIIEFWGLEQSETLEIQENNKTVVSLQSTELGKEETKAVLLG